MPLARATLVLALVLVSGCGAREASIEASFDRPGHAVRVDERGLTLTPRSHTRGAVEPAALVLEHARISRGATAVADDVPVLSTSEDGSLLLSRGAVVERLVDEPGGVAQSWTFAARPGRAGDLVLRMRFSGQVSADAKPDGLHFVDPATGVGTRYGQATWIDATGARVAVAPRFEGEDVVIAVPAEVVDASAYPAVLDPIVSPEIAVDDPTGVLGAAIGDQFEPRVASGGGMYFATWMDGNALRGARVMADGTVLDPAGLDLGVDASDAAVVFDGTAFLAVRCGSGGVEAIGVDLAGNMDPEITISPASAGACDASANGASVLVVWTSGDIYGSGAIAAARVLDDDAVTPTSLSAVGHAPSIAFDGTNHLVVWIWNGDVHRARLAADGSVIDPPAALINTSASDYTPMAASDGTDFLVAWGAYESSATKVVAARVTGSGLTPSFVGVPYWTGLPDAVTFNGTHFLVAGECKGVRVLPDGTVVDPAPVSLCPAINGSTWDGQMGATSDGTDFFLAWTQNAPVTDVDVFGRRMTAAGALDPGFAISAGAAIESWPAAAFDGDNFLVVWSDTRGIDGGNIYGVRVTPGGAVIDAQPIPISTAPGAQHGPAVGFDGTNYLVAWQDWRETQATTFGGKPAIWASRVTPDGDVLDEFVVSTGPAIKLGGGTWDHPRAPPSAVVPGNGHYLVVWSTHGYQYHDVFATRVGFDGTVLDPMGIPIGLGGSNMSPVWAGRPKVSFDGENHLVVWSGPETDNFGLEDIRAARVDAAGVVLDPHKPYPQQSEHILVHAVAGMQTAPSVAFDGENHVVVWQHGDAVGTANANILGARVTPDGSVLDPLGLVVAVAPGKQAAPAIAFDGSELVVAWEDTQAGSIAATRLLPDGTLKDFVAGFVLAEGQLGLRAPTLATDGHGRTLVAHEAGDFGATRVRARLLTNLGLGEPCAAATECSSAQCVDGVCCDVACAGPCDACSVALGSVADGVCAIVGAAAALTCGSTYLCDGASASCPTACTSDAGCAATAFCGWAGVCLPRKQAAAACDDLAGQDCLIGGCRVCETDHCVDGFCCNAPCDESCDVCAQTLGAVADGTCSPAAAGYSGSPSCEPFECDGTSTTCEASCDDDDGCAADHFCANGTCQPDEADGAACAQASQCASGHCADGVCCNVACAGQCEACDDPTSVGACTPIEGEPRPSKLPCSSGGGDVCAAEACRDADGDGATECAPTKDAPCREASCEDDVLTLAATCDGKGTCPLVTQPCVPFSCANATCNAAPCASDEQCAQGYRCEAGACVQGATCDGDHTVTRPDGTRLDCSPYRCGEEGVCRASCDSVAECVAEHVCDSSGVCAPAGGDTSLGDCACRAGGARGSGAGAIAASLVALAIAWRRRSGSSLGLRPRHAVRCAHGWSRRVAGAALAVTALACSSGDAGEQRAFVAAADGWRLEQPSLHVRADATGLEVSRPGGASLRLDAARIARGTDRVDADRASIRLETGGVLALDRVRVVERLVPRATGVEQTWTFDARPGTSGDLTVRMRVGGLSYAGESTAGLVFGGPGGAVTYGPAAWVDARGTRTPLVARHAGGEIVIAVPGEIVDASTYPAVLDPLISADAVLDAPQLGPAFGADAAPVAAFDGTNYLAVWMDALGWIHGTRITPAGVVLDPAGITISDSPTATGADVKWLRVGPAVGVAYNGSFYLVVWTDERNGAVAGRDVVGVRVSPAGVVLDPFPIPIAITNDDECHPVIASVGGGFVVAWMHGYGGVRYRVVNGDLSMTAPVSTPGSTQGASEPVVTATASEYVLVWVSGWDSYQAAHGAYAATISATGSLVSGPQTLVEHPAYGNQVINPAVASDGTDFIATWETYGSSGQYYGVAFGGLWYGMAPSIVWTGTSYLGTWGTGGARLSSNGTLLDPNGLSFGITPSNDHCCDSRPFGLASDGNGALLLWSDASNPTTGTDIHAARLDAAGTVLDPDHVLLSKGASSETTPVAAFDGQNYLVVWSDTRGDPGLGDVYGIRVSSSGAVVDGAAIPIGTAQGAQVRPAIAFDGSNYLVVWESGGARVSPAGVVLGEVSISLGVGPVAVAFNGADFLVTWTGGAARVAPDGTVLDATPIVLPAGTAGEVASDGDGWLAVGSTASARVAADGTVLDPTGIAVGGQTVSFGGGHYLVVAEATDDLYARRVAPDGTIADATAFPVSVQVGKQLKPASTFDGLQHVVVWEDYRNDPAGDLYAARIDADGSVVDNVVTGVPVDVGDTGSRFVALATDGSGRTLVVNEDRDASPPLTGAPRARSRVLANLPTGVACAVGAECSSGHCSDGICCDSACGAPCDVCSTALGAPTDGVCTIAPAPAGVVCATTYVCDGASSSCPSSCSADAGCAPSAYCDSNGLCLPRKPQGASCDDGAGKDCLVGGCRVCDTGHCADDVCCDQACAGPCDVCDAALGAPADGSCGPAPAGAKGEPSCEPSECDGLSASCAGACSTDLDCIATAHCDAAGTCQLDLPNGDACTEAQQCTSSLCVDGVCCDDGCWGQCEACDVAGYEGTCTPVIGAPHGDRPPCFGGDGMDPCTAESCDGVACAPVHDVPCHEASCTDDVATLAATCDGSGACPLVTESCLPRACGGATCKDGPCAGDVDCAAGYRCAEGECLEGARCDGDHTLELPGGSIQDCAPYRCNDDGACLEACTSNAECASGIACGADGKCGARRPSATPVDEGCGCRAAGAGDDGSPLRAAIVLLCASLVAARRSRGRAAALLPLVAAATIASAGCSDDTTAPSGGGPSGGGGGAGPECTTADDCAAPDASCRVPACEAGACTSALAPAGTDAADQTPGDCRRIVCDGGEGVAVVDDESDPFDDGNSCTDDLCDAGSPTNYPRPVGSACDAPETGLCDGNGACVECLVGADCASGVCEQSQCLAATCFDGIVNGAETDVDCGGSCVPCGLGEACRVGSDCEGGYCAGNPPICQPPTCVDGVQDGTETDVDCGGGCPAGCGPSQTCLGDDDCTGGLCQGGACAPTCTDGVANSGETDVDCGGPACGPCADGAACAVDADCASAVCSGAPLACSAPACSDGVTNGAETDVDCGAACPSGCGPGQGCLGDSDCTGGLCSNGSCAPTCSDQVKNLFETDVDCGGQCPTGCAAGEQCSFCTDCEAGLACSSGVCSTPQCPTGFADCNADYCNDVCETSVGFSQAMCGDCNVACTGACWEGACDAVWAHGWGDTSTEAATAMAVDAAGNAYVAGTFQTTIDFGNGPLTAAAATDSFLVKLDPQGNAVWSKSLGGAIATAVATNGTHVAVAGRFTTTVDLGTGPLTNAGSNDVFVAELDASGTVVWAHGWGDASSQIANTVAFDAAGNIVVGGTFSGNMDFGGGPVTTTGGNDGFVAKLGAGGVPVWTKAFGGATNDTITALGIGPQDAVFVGGGFTGTANFGAGPHVSAGSGDIFVLKLDASGAALWSKTFGNASIQNTRALAVTSTGGVAFTGDFQGTLDFGTGPMTNGAGPFGFNAYVAALDAAGATSWSRHIDSVSSMSSPGRAIAADAAGGVAVTGAFSTSIVVASFLLVASGADVFVVRFDGAGALLSAQAFGDGAGRAIAVDGADFVRLAGSFAGALGLFGDDNPALAEIGGQDAFVARMAACKMTSACVGDVECCSQSCVSGQCEALCKAANQPCASDGECCIDSCVAGKCQLCKEVGEPCTVDAECCDGNTCSSGSCVTPQDCCTAGGLPGCSDAAVQSCVCGFEPSCCTTMWDWLCVDYASTLCAACP